MIAKRALCNFLFYEAEENKCAGEKLFFLDVSILWGDDERILQKSMLSSFPEERLSKVFPATIDTQILEKLFVFDMKSCTNGVAHWMVS